MVVYSAEDNRIATALLDQLAREVGACRPICTEHEPYAEDREALHAAQALILLLSNASLADERFCALRNLALEGRRERVVPVQIEETVAASAAAFGLPLVPREPLQTYQNLAAGLEAVCRRVGALLPSPKEPDPEMNEARKTLKVLFLAPAPRGEHALRQKQEKEKVLAALAEVRPAIEVRWEFATMFEEIAPAILRESPDIVHISGHGGVYEGDNVLAFEDELGQRHLVRMDEVVALFAAALITKRVRCLILSTCKGAPIASRVAQSLGLAIASSTDISDDAALAFAKAFYGALAYAPPDNLASGIEGALEIARSIFSSLLKKGSGQAPPQLFRKGDPLVDLPTEPPPPPPPSEQSALPPEDDIGAHVHPGVVGAVEEDIDAPPPGPARIIIVHVLLDGELVAELTAALRAKYVAARIEFWDLTKMPIGALIEDEWARQVATAQGAVLLASTNALADPTWDKVLNLLLARAKAGKVALFPVYLRPCALEFTPLRGRTFYPKNMGNKAMSSLSADRRSEVWSELVRDLLATFEPPRKS